MSITPVGIIPAYLIAKDKKDEVIAFLAHLPGPARRRKEIYVGWCNLVGVVLDEESVEKVVGPYLPLTRG